MSTLGERIKTARETKGYLQSDLAKLIGVKSSGVISNWEKDLNKPDAEKIVKICEVLDVSASFLLNYYGKSTFECTPPEQELLKKYRFLDPYGQETVNIVLDREVARVTTIQKQADRIAALESRPAAIIDFQQRSDQAARIAEYFHSASAGGGVFILGNEATSKIIVSESDWDDRVDYVISVAGHSMEPDYCDGDKVMVSQRMEMRHGDVGIFVINGKAYIKEYGERELISRNPDFDNIKISEYDNIVCMGKVIGKLTDEYKIIDD